jgi:hypothetical protein
MITTLQGDAELNKQQFSSQIEELTNALATAADTIASFKNATSSGLAQLKEELHTKIGDDIAANEASLKNHVTTATAEFKDDFDEKFQNISATFDEVDARFVEAGVWEYTFSGSSANNDNFAYWFSIDFGGQGSANDEQAAGANGGYEPDSYHNSEWFIEIEAKGTVLVFCDRLLIKDAVSCCWRWIPSPSRLLASSPAYM